MEKRIFVIGLGKMGSALADALVAKGHDVSVWNRTIAKSERYAIAGARVAGSVAEGFRMSDVIVVCLLDNNATMSTLASADLDESLAGKTIVQLSTISPAESRALDSWARERGSRYLDGGILDYPDGVRNGTAAGIVFSGSEAAFEELKAIFAAWSERPKLISELAGVAPVADKIVYAFFYGLTFSYLHAAALAIKGGIPWNELRELLNGDNLWQWRGKAMAHFLDMADDRAYGGSDICELDVHASAYQHIVRLSRELDVEAAFPELISKVMSRAIENGHGGEEIAAIFEVLGGHRDRFKA